MFFRFLGLTCAMYVKDGVQVLCPDGNAGLYVKTRNGEIVKVIDFSYSGVTLFLINLFVRFAIQNVVSVTLLCFSNFELCVYTDVLSGNKAEITRPRR